MPSIKLTFTATHVTRIQNAITETLELEAPVTVVDVKKYIIQDLQQLVRTSERRVAVAAVETNNDVEIT